MPLIFRLDSWEDLVRALSRIPPGKPLFGVHIDLKNACWSSRLGPAGFCAFGRARVFRPSSWGATPLAGTTLRTFAGLHSRWCCRGSSPRFVAVFLCSAFAKLV